MSSQEYISEGLFSPITIGSLDTKNRFVMAPMTREYSVDGTPPKDSIDYYVKRAQGGIGLIITEGAVVDHGPKLLTQFMPLEEKLFLRYGTLALIVTPKAPPVQIFQVLDLVNGSGIEIINGAL